jgi:hypothetical protein
MLFHSPKAPELEAVMSRLQELWGRTPTSTHAVHLGFGLLVRAGRDSSSIPKEAKRKIISLRNSKLQDSAMEIVDPDQENYSAFTQQLIDDAKGVQQDRFNEAGLAVANVLYKLTDPHIWEPLEQEVG